VWENERLPGKLVRRSTLAIIRPGRSSKLDDYIDRSLVDELDRKGFFTEIQRKYGMHRQMRRWRRVACGFVGGAA
jgi:hypothetical protein